MTDKAIAWVRQQKAAMPDKPFFTSFAPGAWHAPHHVPKEWADKGLRFKNYNVEAQCDHVIYYGSEAGVMSVIWRS